MGCYKYCGYTKAELNKTVKDEIEKEQLENTFNEYKQKTVFRRIRIKKNNKVFTPDIS